MVISQLAARAAQLTGCYGATGQHPDQVDAITIATARCEVIRQSLELFIQFVYQVDSNGFFVNLSGNTSIPVGVWTPWSSAGKPRSRLDDQGRRIAMRAQLSEQERKIVRTWLNGLKRDRRFPAFFYHAPARRWYVDTTRYHDLADACAWLDRNRLDATTFVAIKNTL
jgi:hypothetical protein